MTDTIVFNMTMLVGKAIATEWLKWMQEIHIPEIIGTGFFTKYQVLKLLEVDQTEGLTYAIQFYASTKMLLDEYHAKYAGEMSKKRQAVWGNRIISFNTTMQVVN